MTEGDGMPQLGAILGTRWLGRPHEHHCEPIASTNDRALAWAADGAPEGALVTADLQTAGRGRLGRAWSSSDAGDVYASFVLHPGRELSGGWIPLLAALGIHRALRRWLPRVVIKWPNDLLVGERKLAGILCEGRWDAGRGVVVVGLGINVARRVFPPELEASATSCARELGDTAPDRVAVLAAVLAELEGLVDGARAHGVRTLRSPYLEVCTTVGRRLAWSGEGGRELRGTAVDVAEDGALVVEPDDGGPRQRVVAGEVRLS
jgi:BirA family biotin operon repressor/biotin-[acetyl-CoA-carboxylase] ligase